MVNHPTRQLLGLDLQMLSPALAMIKRELLSTLRNPRQFHLLSITLLGLLGALIFYFKENPPVDMRNQLAMSQISTLFFLGYSYTLYAIVISLVPTVASNAICSEKQQDQLDLVRMTYIGPAVFLLGKAVNVLGLFTLVVVATLPFAAVLFYFPGIDWMQYGQMLMLIALVAGANAMAGLLCSAYCYRTIPAAIGTYILVLFIHFGAGFSAMAISIVAYQYGFIQIADWHDALIVVMVPLNCISDLSRGSMGPLFFLVALGYYGAVILICGTLSCRLLNRPTAPMKVNQEATIADPALLEARRKQFPFYLIDPRRQRPQIGDHQNPLLAKERYTSLANRGTTTIRILYTVSTLAVIAGAFVAALSDTFNAHENILTFLAIETFLLLGIVPIFVATTFSKEIEWGNWDMLRMTLLTPQDVVWGKFLGALHGLALPVGALLLGVLPLLECVFRQPRAADTLVLGLLLLASAIVYFCALSMTAAIRRTRSLPALISTYVIGAVLLFLVPVGFIAWGELIEKDARFAQAYWLSPATVFLADLWAGEFIVFNNVLAQCLILLFVSALLLRWTVARCHRRWYVGVDVPTAYSAIEPTSPERSP